jgi:hypothetical protein
MSDAMEQNRRPSVSAELRAWIAVGSVLSINLIGGIWWAATLSAELTFMRELMGELRTKLSAAYTSVEAKRDRESVDVRLIDHENRLRQLERTGGK